MPSLLLGKGIQSPHRASKEGVQENLRVAGVEGLARRREKLASDFMDGSLLSGKKHFRLQMSLPEWRMPWALGELGLCLLEFGGMKTGTWLSRISKI